MHTYSEYQKTIFKNIAFGTGHTVVIARAGSSKTYSLVEGSKYLPKGKKSLFCAFNKSIQEELKSKLKDSIECLTLHSLGFRGVKQRFGTVELDNNKCWKIVKDLGIDNYDLIDNICKTISFCKSNLVDSPSKIEELIEQYDLDYCNIEPKDFIRYVIQGLSKCKAVTNVIDYNDMIWFPFVHGINVGKYDFVFIDEGHDLSKAQMELAISAAKSDGRIILVIDPAQAIYAFNGADPEVLKSFQERFSPIELPLPICYRCPLKVIKLLQTIVPDILPYSNAIEGEIIDIKVSELQKYAKPGSYVVSRLNAPLIKHCLNFLKNGIPANILGRDMGDNLLYLIKKSKKKKLPELLKWLVKWEKDEKERILLKYPNANTDSVVDKAECINMLCEGAKSVEDVKNNIKDLFKDKTEKNIVLFSSVHRIKGKEADEVFVLTDTLRSFDETEINIKYVALSRVKKKLYLVGK